MTLTVYMGYDYREVDAYNVAEHSIKRHASEPIAVVPLDINNLTSRGLIWRPVERRDTIMWDVISDAPQATEFASSRFLTPILHTNNVKQGKHGWVIFMDCDVLIRSDLNRITDFLDEKYAVMCVKHNYIPSTTVKMDGQVQTKYSRKNWSSVMAFNCDHPANKALTVSLINSEPGRNLHNFCWLTDDLIGELPREWNSLLGEPGYSFNKAVIAHYTLGGPWMGIETSKEADAAWYEERESFNRSVLNV